jgi:ABC-type sugar transport system permease subunit
MKFFEIFLNLMMCALLILVVQVIIIGFQIIDEGATMTEKAQLEWIKKNPRHFCRGVK